MAKTNYSELARLTNKEFATFAMTEWSGLKDGDEIFLLNSLEKFNATYPKKQISYIRISKYLSIFLDKYGYLHTRRSLTRAGLSFKQMVITIGEFENCTKIILNYENNFDVFMKSLKLGEWYLFMDLVERYNSIYKPNIVHQILGHYINSYCHNNKIIPKRRVVKNPSNGNKITEIMFTKKPEPIIEETPVIDKSEEVRNFIKESIVAPPPAPMTREQKVLEFINSHSIANRQEPQIELKTESIKEPETKDSPEVIDFKRLFDEYFFHKEKALFHSEKEKEFCEKIKSILN